MATVATASGEVALEMWRVKARHTRQRALRALAIEEQKDKLWDDFKERRGLRPRGLSKAP